MDSGLLRLLRWCYAYRNAEIARQDWDLSRLLRCYAFLGRDIHTREQSDQCVDRGSYIRGALPRDRNRRNERNIPVVDWVFTVTATVTSSNDRNGQIVATGMLTALLVPDIPRNLVTPGRPAPGRRASTVGQQLLHGVSPRIAATALAVLET